MSSGLPSTGPLAVVLREASDDELVEALHLRGFSDSVNTLKGVRDFFDLAEAFLSERSLEQCLTRLDRHSLTALVWLGEQRMGVNGILDALAPDDHVLRQLKTLFLVHATNDGGETEGAVWPEVTAQLVEWPNHGLPDLRIVVAEPAFNPVQNADNPGTAAQHAIDNLSAERAFFATTAIAELLFTVEREPVKLLATGMIGRPSERKLAEVLRVEEKSVGIIVAVAEYAGLVRRHNGTLSSSASYREWLEKGHAERWVAIAEAWAATQWRDIRSRLSQRLGMNGNDLREWLTWNYPGGRDWLPDHTAARLHEAELLGITAHEALSTVGTRILAGDTVTSAALLADTLPTPIDRLYLQHDLTAVATGPLQPKIDTRLRTMAEVDGHTIASRYRFTKASINRAVNEGESAASILEFLGTITLSGIPQPLEYLVTETAARHGLLRVGKLTTDTHNALSYIRSEDEMLLRTVLIDRNLTTLRLRPRDSEYLLSSWEHNELYAALHEAKYPVAIEDIHGRIVQATPPTPTRIHSGVTEHMDPADPLRKLIERIRVAHEHAPDSSDEAWLARQLDAAIRAKTTVTVSVKMPNGNVVDYRLEPAAIFGGRLRARDPLSEIERTLPLSSIVAVSKA